VLPDVPLIGDVVTGYAVTGHLGIGAPRSTAAAIVERLNREVNAVLTEPTVQARMADLGSEPLSGSAADFAELIAEETEKWGEGGEVRWSQGGLGRSIASRIFHNLIVPRVPLDMPPTLLALADDVIG
jgi:hypothetical protein